ncbi:bifunctional diaminohydroxyphosphoribosylaminopyrimidine deaminase/5-amino-6-(5-phosphoribosylamino)uracil reductase RibD [Clostridium sp. BJN0013]|uniref:bifunctional diaminohydroxyphosphoribosylaminopyrimidine deaminase/5-amino-6-(5-phosphoribosylamino)uracil reductase RibD n=1 Tax=Clostridium sp. BJN0013 TaxID=3236840 RepID=UPI0034C683CD
MNYDNKDEHYMKIALDLALKGEGFVNPNPQVGAVIVKEGKIVGKGYHKFYGGPHAEVYALKEAGDKAVDGQIYVTLEPCSHYGKTPPCAEAIAKAGIKKVVVALKDPNPLVSGRGIKFLRDRGIEVVTGVLEKEALNINEIFIKYISEKLPFVILKSAITLDGKIATVTGQSKWITCEESRNLVHHIRNRVMAIGVGIGTILSDNPLLTTRLEKKCKSPIAVILDSKLRIPLGCKIFDTLKYRKIIIACTEEHDMLKKHEIEKMGVDVIICPKDEFGHINLKILIEKLGDIGIDSLLIEGGGTLNFSALNSGIVDKIVYFIAPKIIGGLEAKTSVEGKGIEDLNNAVKLKNISYSKSGEDMVVQGYVEK